MAQVTVSREHIREGVLIITFNRPKVYNCVDGETAQLLQSAFVSFEHDDEAKVAILHGEGGNFCSGADLSAILNRSTDSHTNLANPMDPDMSTIGPMGVSRLSLSKPVIAAISGYCLAGGLELACWCDLRVVGSDAKIGVKCRLRGVPLIDGGTIRLPRLIGLSHATDLILTGRTIGAEEAYRIGFANRIVPTSDRSQDQVLAAAISLAAEIAQYPQTCLRNDRLSMREAVFGPFFSGKSEVKGRRDVPNVTGGERAMMTREFELGLESLSSDEYLEKLKQFLGRGKL